MPMNLSPYRHPQNPQFLRLVTQTQGQYHLLITFLMVTLALWWPLVDKLGLSYRTSMELNDIIDKALPGCPSFQCEDMNLGDECLQFHYCEIIPCIRSLFGNPEFAHRLMHTGDWWWSVQTSLEAHHPGATVVPLIISSDKTQLMLFQNKSAYPIYMGIGNIPKEIHQKPSRTAQMLIGYILTTKLTGITNKATCCRTIANLFHSCMERVLHPIHAIGETGLAMWSGDGIWRRCHPILATFCLVPVDQLGNYIDFPAQNHVDMVDTYMLASEDIRQFRAPIFRPFWTALPLVDIFLSITPDVLHQLLQGVVKHVKAWLTRIFGAAEVDARCRTLPPNHHITLFTKGITTLSRISGKEHKNICRILLGLIINLALPGGQLPTRVIRAVRALLDFIQTLQHLEECLAHFHENKDIFIDLGVHSLLHYRSSITLFGTTDNYNMEQFEQLHIDFTKGAYHATNRKDEYSQMTVWLEHRGKVQMHMAFVEWQEQNDLTSPLISATSTGPFYGAIDFQDALADFIALINYPSASAAALRSQAADTLLPFWENSEDFEIVDSVVIQPEQKDAHGRTVPERFDTMLVCGRQDIMHGNNGHRIGQVQVVFQIPSKVIHDVFLNNAPTHLAYIEWFSPLSPRPDVNHLMYKVSRSVQGGCRHATVILVDRIMGSVHLIPQFGRATPHVTPLRGLCWQDDAVTVQDGVMPARQEKSG
ncbi:hypothetical protein H4582DRAFT_2112453 [Lactarius indigo]|nr:hypothetical protein H4582DRAFT_2112453 [Lactarius indigo]